MIKKLITTAFLFLLLGIGAWQNLAANIEEISQNWSSYILESSNLLKDWPAFVAETNNVIDTKASYKYEALEAYGLIQTILLKNEVGNFAVVKDQDNQLHYTYFTNGPNDVSQLAARMGRLNQVVKASDAELIYLMTPDKYEPGVTQLSRGMPYNYANETADNFLDLLTKYEIDFIDYRDLLQRDGMTTDDVFYRTDHHWTIQSTFWAYTQLVEELEARYGWEFLNKDFVTNLDHFNQILYKDTYIGSMGRSVGYSYAGGVEDFTLIYPKFETDFHIFEEASVTDDVQRQGRFEDSILNPAILKDSQDIYDVMNDKYFTYMDGNPGIVQITNLSEEAANEPRVLFIKDSMIVPVASFFSLGTESTMLIDPRYYGGSIEEVVETGDFDYVFVTYTPQNLTEEFFPFYE
ncbi:alginate O-acetyltransferase AlgX-related protein [Fundicoccus sp. Sow4_D5]|uniref:alginate O-acetyltransferase AlgX-related protein n=1 Tax=Fundicoccus sp. Sow4_D5 TaxID=3438782 RepID=UPI003F90E747